ncbi:MAG TPA: BamA/TamA family outer membrane protein, partial [Patescibacteria group bacterium]|nr:BamA/TamA family outer membrane protein [Patescibacteria group bacterium]
QAGTDTLSSVAHTLTWDHRDSRTEPTGGYYLKFGNEVAGAGGDDKFLRNTVGAGTFFKVADQSVLMFSGTGGYIVPLEDSSIRINQRYFLGGDTLRGFKDAGVSPRDAVTNDALGGLWDYTGTAELTFPLGVPKELGIQGKLFTDVGAIGGVDKSIVASDITQSTQLRMSIGTGVVWKSPMGPINVDLGFPIMRDSHDETQIFRLNFGTRF